MVLSSVLAFWLILASEHTPADLCRCPCHQHSAAGAWIFHDEPCCHPCGNCGLGVKVHRKKPMTLGDKRSFS